MRYLLGIACARSLDVWVVQVITEIELSKSRVRIPVAFVINTGAQIPCERYHYIPTPTDMD